MAQDETGPVQTTEQKEQVRGRRQTKGKRLRTITDAVLKTYKGINRILLEEEDDLEEGGSGGRDHPHRGGNQKGYEPCKEGSKQSPERREQMTERRQNKIRRIRTLINERGKLYEDIGRILLEDENDTEVGDVEEEEQRPINTREWAQFNKPKKQDQAMGDTSDKGEDKPVENEDGNQDETIQRHRPICSIVILEIHHFR